MNMRFTLVTLLLMLSLVSVIGAATLYLIRVQDLSEFSVFIPFVLIAPMGTMVLISNLIQFVGWLRRAWSKE